MHGYSGGTVPGLTVTALHGGGEDLVGGEERGCWLQPDNGQDQSSLPCQIEGGGRLRRGGERGYMIQHENNMNDSIPY